jgi:hypothetical protein
MRAGRAQKNVFAEGCRTWVVESAKAGVCPSRSDSIGEDFRVPLISNGEGQRQTKQAGLTGTKIPCHRSPYNTQYFPFWNQPVATGSGCRSRQVKIIYAYPKEAGAKMATLGHFDASLLYGVFSGNLQTQDAVSMANPEV